MTDRSDPSAAGRPFGLRLDTLVRLRWLAVAGQMAVLVGVYWVLGFDLPIVPAFAVVALTATTNIALAWYQPAARRLDDRTAGLMLAYDILQLAILLFLTGGIVNPFCVLLLAPVLISATALSPRTTLLLGALSIVSITALALFHFPLPWYAGAETIFPPLFRAGVWFAILLALVFVGIYAWRIAEERSQISDALAATELVLAREQHLSALDGLAAAAAHELGTPLATVALVVRELERELPPTGPHADDLKLLREQTERCRAILGTLTTLGSGDAPFDRMPLSLLLHEVAAPHRPFDVEIHIDVPTDQGSEPVVARNPGILYGLGNLVENAVDFAKSRVDISARWDTDEVRIEIADDGPGFAAGVLDRLGEPYLSVRGARRGLPADDPGGLGLGFFIAKTLLERTGATLAVENRLSRDSGAIVRVRWPRRELERAAPSLPAQSFRVGSDAGSRVARPAAE
jgi:two-component system sensor histidine kinase RegB